MTRHNSGNVPVIGERPERKVAMKTSMLALALLLGLAVGGAALMPSGQAHAANTSWTNANSGGGNG